MSPFLLRANCVYHRPCDPISPGQRECRIIRCQYLLDGRTGEFVSIVAFTFGRLHDASALPHHIPCVFPWCAEKQVAGIATGGIIAVVTNIQAFGYRAVYEFPGITVRTYVTTTTPYMAVTPSIFPPGPQPTNRAALAIVPSVLTLAATLLRMRPSFNLTYPLLHQNDIRCGKPKAGR